MRKYFHAKCTSFGGSEIGVLSKAMSIAKIVDSYNCNGVLAVIRSNEQANNTTEMNSLLRKAIKENIHILHRQNQDHFSCVEHSTIILIYMVHDWEYAFWNGECKLCFVFDCLGGDSNNDGPLLVLQNLVSQPPRCWIMLPPPTNQLTFFLTLVVEIVNLSTTTQVMGKSNFYTSLHVSRRP